MPATEQGQYPLPEQVVMLLFTVLTLPCRRGTYCTWRDAKTLYALSLTTSLCVCLSSAQQVIQEDARIGEIHNNSETFDSKAELSFKYLQVRFSGPCLHAR